jgi:hypothetical protein
MIGGFDPSEKYEFVNGKDDIPHIMEKTCSKPPTSNHRLTSLVPYCGNLSKSPVFQRWLTPLLIAGWWCNFTILKKDGVRQWDGCHPRDYGKFPKMIETTNQPLVLLGHIMGMELG